MVLSVKTLQSQIPDMHAVVGTHDVVLISLDTLRYDVAQAQWQAGLLPTLAAHMPAGGFERRHTAGSFTYAAHHAFFAGFLPTPDRPGPHPRLFALAFDGSETTAANTFVFDHSASVPQGFAGLGYRTICIGGVGFFNLRNPLGRVLPALFCEQHWEPGFAVTAADSTERQVALACARLRAVPERVFLFLNISALHQPNCGYLPGCSEDNVHSQGAALRYVDAALAPLFSALQQRGKAFVIACADHGTAYGEDHYRGHRHPHPVVMQVPYCDFTVSV